MEIQLNLDEMTERYVRSMETKVEAYRARTWTLFAAGVLLGIIIGSMTALGVLP